MGGEEIQESESAQWERYRRERDLVGLNVMKSRALGSIVRETNKKFPNPDKLVEFANRYHSYYYGLEAVRGLKEEDSRAWSY